MNPLPDSFKTEKDAERAVLVHTLFKDSADSWEEEYLISELKDLAQLLPNGQFTALDSSYGHDAFLIEFDQLTHLLSRFLATT